MLSRCKRGQTLARNADRYFPPEQSQQDDHALVPCRMLENPFEATERPRDDTDGIARVERAPASQSVQSRLGIGAPAQLCDD